MRLLEKLKPASFPEEIQDPQTVKKTYKYWRLRTFIGMYVGYAFYYLTRKSMTFAMPSMLDQGFTLAELGMLGSILSIVYGFSKFFSGIMGDKTNPRYFMSFGLILTGICNICFGFSTMWALLALFWGLNAWFQGWGWPGCAKLFTHWYSQSERGRWWSVWNTSHNVGGALIPLIAVFIAHRYGWRSAMAIPGILSILVGLFLINRLRDIPQSLGLPPIEKFKGEASTPLTKEVTLSVREILFKYVLRNEYIWLIAFAYFFIYIIRIGFNDWMLVYLIKSKGYPEMKSATCVLWFEIGGFLGSLFAGWASDKMFGGRRSPAVVLFTVGAIVSLLALYRSQANLLMWDAAIIFCIGFFIFGPQMLIGIAAVEMTHKKAAATASGFAGCFAYIGAAVAGGPLGALTHAYGWGVFFTVLLACGLTAFALMLPLWMARTGPTAVALSGTVETEQRETKVQ